MQENIGAEQYRAEISALNREIAQLSRLLEESENRQILPPTNPLDPFDNPTEYEPLKREYTDILPQIQSSGYKIPLNPLGSEKRKLRRFYSIGGWCVLFQFILTNVAALLIMWIISGALRSINPGTESSVLSSYVKSSSIFAGINLLTYLISNVGIAFLGLNWSKSSKLSLVRTYDFGFGKAVKYCLMGLFIWMTAVYLSIGINDIFTKYGYTTNVVDLDGVGSTGIGFSVMTIYTCLIAPVTEELFYRGMLLRVFSRSNQRFAVFASAFFFGLGHGNIPQFLLAFMIGVFLGHITLKHGSIIPSVIVHIFINTNTTVMSEFGKVLNKTETSVLGLVMLLAALLGAFIMYIFRADDQIPATTPAQSRRGFEIARTSIPFVLAGGLELFYMIILIIENIY